MNIGSYRGAASLAAYEKWQSVTAQNIAASSMPGYKKTEVSFESIAADKLKLNASNSLSGESAGSMPQVGTKTNFTPGQLHRTGNELDFAIQGNGFFKVKRENGEIGYTRNGQFKLGPDRGLITNDGFPVLGENGPITLDPAKGAVSVNSEGAITQGGQVIAKLAIVDAKDPQQLTRLGDLMFGPPASGADLERVDNPQIVNGYVESSNVSALNEMVNLITISRAYEASQKTMINDGDTSDKAIQTLGNPQA